MSVREDSKDRIPDAKALPRTVSHMFGEIVWILSQSPLHKHLSLADLEWMVMPSLLLEQYRVFRDGDRPIGVALWAFISDEVEKKLVESRARLRPDEWRSGNKPWLAELIAPFGTPENQQVARMLTDLSTIVFKGKPFNLLQTDLKTGERRVHTVGTERQT